MRLTLSALSQYLDNLPSAEEICATLTKIGLEVESITDEGRALDAFTVAQIVEAKKHENSDKLKICQVETINGKLQIICGAANAREGLKVAYAPIGSVIPTNGMVIKKAKIAGVESSGMLCSVTELGLEAQLTENGGIIEIAENQAIGAKIRDIFGINEIVAEINVTPNRGDCLGVYGIARDLAAAGVGKLKSLKLEPITSKFPFALSVTNDAPEACGYAAFRQIRNIKNCESPAWLKSNLAAIGIKSISAVVDITNYVMYLLNRPMHAYDASKIKVRIEIRFAHQDEKMTSLKGNELALDEKILVIADSKNGVGIAGVIGSNNSSCELSTTEIILEPAFFNPSTVAYAGRKLNILSDARHRFERGIDPNSCEDGIELATKFILEICGGEASEIKAVGKKSINKKIKFDFSKIKKRVGIEIGEGEAIAILTKLGFVVSKDGANHLVEIPSHRHDIFADEDLVEEVIRIYGYDKIELTPLVSELARYNKSPIDKIRSNLVNAGLTEIISWSFVDSKLVEIFTTETSPILANPIASNMDQLRPSLAIGLLDIYQKNLNRGFADLALFEIGNLFKGNQQILAISGLRAGKNLEQNHYREQRDFDVFDVKSDCIEVIKTLGISVDRLQIVTDSLPSYLHPHRSAALKIEKEIVGFFGEIHPQIAKKFDLKNRANFFEIFFDKLPINQKAKGNKPFLANDFPMVERDFAFILDKNFAVDKIVKTIAGVDRQLIKSVEIFDIFSGKNLAEDKKSVALRVKIQPQTKTLTSEEIDVISQKIITAVKQEHKAEIRE